MKKIFLLLLFNLFLHSCKEEKMALKHSVNISTVVDLTDLHTLTPKADPILKLYGFDRNKNQEGCFRICTVTDKRLNPTLEFHIPDGATTKKDNQLDNPYYRENLVLSFYKKVRNAISDFDTTHLHDSSLRYSECFQTITTELHLMKNKQSKRNVLLIFSDLQENSDLFNCYSKVNQELLRRKPADVAKIFNNTHLLPDSLTGIEIVFIFQPITRSDDQQFGLMAGIYKKLLEARGATVKIQANNDYLN